VCVNTCRASATLRTIIQALLVFMSRLMEKSPRYKAAFRTTGGFQTCVALLRGIAHASGTDGAGDAERAALVLAALRCMATALVGAPENRAYFAKEVRFASLLAPLRAPFLLAPDRALDVCEHLLGLAVHERWPHFPAVLLLHVRDLPSALRLRCVVTAWRDWRKQT